MPRRAEPDGRGAGRRGSITAEEAIVRLREKIERLGPVNMMAIEQFDELETRHSFLTTQRKDLTESIAQTTEAIERIDETTSARFNEAFTAVQANFQQTFSTLFGGGHAGLALLDENDPLESGIDIVASPPGKRLQSVQLLSGGEKALTAIALMFAIFRYKPSPFCLLDEIDAPLDDANVGPLRRHAARHDGPHAVHPDHAQPPDDGDRQPALRRDDGRAGRLEADLRPPALAPVERRRGERRQVHTLSAAAPPGRGRHGARGRRAARWRGWHRASRAR